MTRVQLARRPAPNTSVSLFGLDPISVADLPLIGATPIGSEAGAFAESSGIAITGASALYPDLPAGYTMPGGYACTFSNGTLNGALGAEGIFKPFAASGGFNQQLRDGSTYSPSGATAPRHPPSSPNLIGEVIYPAGMSLSGISAGGMGTGSGTLTPNGWTGLYCMFAIQLSSNFVSHPSGVNKVIVGNIHGNPCLVVSATSASFWEFRLQNLWNNGSGGGARNVSDLSGGTTGAAPVTKGLWQVVEIQCVANTPGVTNGIVRLWLTNYNSSGVKVSGPTKLVEATNIGWSSSTQANVWESESWDPIYGGTSAGTLAATQYVWMDHMALAGA